MPTPMRTKKKASAYTGNKNADELAELIIKGLATAPHSSGSLCIVALARALPLFHSLVGGVDYIDRIRTAYGRVLDAYAHFAGTVLSSDQLRFILDNVGRNRSRSCGCTLRNQTALVREIHLTGYLSPYNKPRSALYVLITYVFEILSSVCLDIPVGKLEKHKARKKWPLSVAMMIPNGPEATIEAIGQWVIITENTAPLRALGCMVQYCPSLQAPLLAGPYFPLLIEEHFRRKMLHLLIGPPPELELVHKTRKGADYIMDFYYLFNGFISFLDGTFIGKCFQDYAPSIYRSFCLSFQSLPELDFDLYFHAQDIEGCWLGHALASYSALPRGGEAHDHFMLHPVLVKFRDQSGLWTPDQPASLQLLHRMHIDVVRVGLMALFRRTSCSNPKCDHTCETLGRSFRICSGCRCARYCSYECQSTTWAASEYPHKKFCKLMSILLPLQTSPEFNGMVSEETSLKFQDAALEQGVKPVDFWKLREHLQRLGLFRFEQAPSTRPRASVASNNDS